jgi:adhesin/invasin
VETTDACGNPLSGQPVTWAVTSGSATLQNIVGATDFRGDASVIVQLGNSAGPVIVTATSGSFSASFTLAVNLVASQLVITAGNNQTVAVGQQAPQSLTVAVQDANGSGVPGIAVTFSVSSGPGTVATSQTTSDSTGHASTTLTAGATPGTISILASAVGKTVTFTVTSVGRTPIVSTVGFVNGASFQPGWVPGSTGSIFGTGLSEGVNGVVLANQAPFPTILQGVQVRVQGVLAPIIALANVNGQEQINIQVPFEVTAPSSVTVVITNNGASATFTGIPTLSVQPGVFQFNSNGTQLAAALHANFNVITQADPAKAGETIMLFLTGMGATNPAVSTNVAGPVSTLASTTVSPLVVTVNNQSAKVIGSWYAPFLYTAYQINLVIPPGTTSGLATVIVNAAGSASPAVKIPIQ